MREQKSERAKDRENERAKARKSVCESVVEEAWEERERNKIVIFLHLLTAGDVQMKILKPLLIFSKGPPQMVM